MIPLWYEHKGSSNKMKICILKLWILTVGKYVEFRRFVQKKKILTLSIKEYFPSTWGQVMFTQPQPHPTHK